MQSPYDRDATRHQTASLGMMAGPSSRTATKWSPVRFLGICTVWALLLLGPALPGALQTAEARRLTLTADVASAHLQAFLNADADTLVIMPKRGGWVTGPLRLTRGDRVVILMPGTEIRAAAGAFPQLNDALLTLYGVRNVQVLGYGARLVMRKPEYVEGQWRHALSLMGVDQVTIEGLTTDSSGGDGVYVDGLRDPSGSLESRRVRILHHRAFANRRQGISVISADDLLVEHSRFDGTQGHAPQAGIDFEPDHDGQRLVQCRIRHSVFSGNAGPPALIDLGRLSERSAPVSIRFEHCLFAASPASPGTLVRAYRGVVTEGAIQFSHSTFRNPEGPALTLRATVRGQAHIGFDHCLFDGGTASAFRHNAPPVLRLRETRRADNPTGVLEGATFRASRVRAAGRPLIDADPLDGPVARAIRMEMHLGAGTYLGKPLPGVAVEELSAAPAEVPPAPLLRFLGARQGRVRVELTAWSGDTVALLYPESNRRGTRLVTSVKAGDTLIAVTCHQTVCGEPLRWPAPRYLR